jgi:hypothetical protein
MEKTDLVSSTENVVNKGKFHPVTCQWGTEAEYISLFSTLAVEGMRGQDCAPAALPPVKK